MFCIINSVIINYELLTIPLSTMELGFKLTLSILTIENKQIIIQSYPEIINAANHFKDDFIEALLLVLIKDENDLLNDDVLSFIDQ